MRLTATIAAAVLCASAPLAQACSPGFSSNRNLPRRLRLALCRLQRVDDVSGCSSRCARQCTAPGKQYGACMGCARWKGNAQGKMDLPPCSRPITTANNDGEYECHGYGDGFWNCITPCPPGYESKDLGRG
ncbi:unnamed protein product [Colletotrichum noveboracense]|uniref:Uncharacterized protein n=1 Tax=Colletotrichum noveboracense TaxID=2664923 RepID=A0A9W4W457_9PEZI|nr:hypothetical protein K456DRAFT_1716172 [Colletotrichum gloeosporioides 23]CAI0642313.1 unnamed protein product [Colletotrichum noveboracense]